MSCCSDQPMLNDGLQSASMLFDVMDEVAQRTFARIRDVTELRRIAVLFQVPRWIYRSPLSSELV